MNNDQDTDFTKLPASIVSNCHAQGKERRLSRFTRAIPVQIANCCIYVQNSGISKLLRGAFLIIFKEVSKQSFFPKHLLLAKPLRRSCLQGKKFWLWEEEEFKTNYRIQTKQLVNIFVFFLTSSKMAT